MMYDDGLNELVLRLRLSKRAADQAFGNFGAKMTLEQAIEYSRKLKEQRDAAKIASSPIWSSFAEMRRKNGLAGELLGLNN